MTQIFCASELDENAKKISWKKYKALVSKWGGWFELEIVRFPSDWHCEQFKKEVSAK